MVASSRRHVAVSRAFSKKDELTSNLANDCNIACGQGTFCTGPFQPYKQYSCSCYANYTKLCTGCGCYQTCANTSVCGSNADCAVVSPTRRRANSIIACSCNFGYNSPTNDGKNCVPYCVASDGSSYFSTSRDPSYWSTATVPVFGASGTGLDFSFTGMQMISCYIPASTTAL